MELERWEKVAGSFFYVGYKIKAPGTVTSALVFLAAWFIQSEIVLGYALLVLLPLSFYLGHRFEKCIGHDPSCFTLDEVIGSTIVLWFIPHELFHYLVFFLIWRLFDIFKPLFKPVEQIKHGIGIVLDDVIGALFTGAVYILYTWLM